MSKFGKELIESLAQATDHAEGRRVKGMRVSKPVMPGLVPGIHVLLQKGNKDVDGRDKPGHDENELS